MAINTPSLPVDMPKKRPEVRCDSESTAQTVCEHVNCGLRCILLILYRVSQKSYPVQLGFVFLQRVEIWCKILKDYAKFILVV